MRTPRFLLLVTAFGALLSEGCASTILIQSDPAGAEVTIDGVYHGKAPVQFTDTGIVGTTHQVRLELPGYEPTYASFKRDGNANIGAILGGLCFWIPFLWVLDYPPNVVYKLRPATAIGAPPAGPPGGTSQPPPTAPAALTPPPPPPPTAPPES